MNVEKESELIERIAKLERRVDEFEDHYLVYVKRLELLEKLERRVDELERMIGQMGPPIRLDPEVLGVPPEAVLNPRPEGDDEGSGDT